MKPEERAREQMENFAVHAMVEKVLSHGVLAAYEVASAIADERWRVTSSIAITCAKVTGAYLAMTEDSLEAAGMKGPCPNHGDHLALMKTKLEDMISAGYKETMATLKEAREKLRAAEKTKPHG